MAVDNQKLFSQMADLGRNINILTENVKKNTSAIESMSAGKTDPGNKKLEDSINSLDKTLKDIQKALSNKPAPEVNKTAPAQPTQASPKDSGSGEKKEKFDFNKIAGGVAKTVVRAFQEGGVAPKSGNYLVGENGPEIVSIPKGSGVIPLDLKDLMTGISKVPELSEFLKENSKAGVYGNWGSGLIVTEDGKKINLSKLESIYKNKYDKLEEENGDPKMMEDLVSKMDFIVNMQEKTAKVANDSIRSLTSQRKDILDKSLKDSTDEDFEYISSARNKILKTIDDADFNSYTVAKADLIATQMLLDKKSKESSMKDEFDKLGKIEDKTSDVVNPKVEKAKKDAEKSTGGEKNPEGLFSKLGLKKKSASEEEPKDEKSPEGSKEKKESAFLSKAGNFAESVATGVASKVIGANLPGVGGALAQKGLSSLKNLMSKKKDETAGSKNLSEMKESKPSLNKTDLQAKDALGDKSSLKSDIKKLSPQSKPAEQKKEAEPAKTKEAPKTSSDAQKNQAPQSQQAKDKSKSSSSTSQSESPLGTSKDIDDIKNALSRIASILEGPLTVSPMESPFRPDSRRL